MIVDAVRSGAAAGTVHRVEPGDGPLPRELGLASTHAFSIADTVELARALGRAPARVVVVGVEGAAFEPGRPAHTRRRGGASRRGRRGACRAARADAREGADGRPDGEDPRRRRVRGRRPRRAHPRPPRSALALHAGALPRALRRRGARHARRGAQRSTPTSAPTSTAPNATGVVLESVEVADG